MNTDDQRSRAMANASVMASVIRLNHEDSVAYAPRLRGLIDAARTWIADAACDAGNCLEDVERVRFSFVPPFSGTSLTCHPTEKAKDNLKTLVDHVKLESKTWPNFNFVEISEDPGANNHVSRFCDWSDEEKNAEERLGGVSRLSFLVCPRLGLDIDDIFEGKLCSSMGDLGPWQP